MRVLKPYQFKRTELFWALKVVKRADMSLAVFRIVVAQFLLICLSNHLTIDENGYIAYCPCMGRFGNQAEHFLGAFAFAKGLNRTLILPPWVEYRTGEFKSIQVPFNEYFDIKHLQMYHRVILMEEFMDKLAADVWPPEKRVVFCYSGRGKNSSNCNAKEGNPFGPFWDTFRIDFIGSELYSPLNYDVHYGNMGEKWSAKYPNDKWAVLAFTGAPASFPIQKENIILQKYLRWNKQIEKKARTYIQSHFPRTAFIGVHLRNGHDWKKACQYVNQSPNLFSSVQCLGYRNEHGTLTAEMCYPSQKTIIRQLKRAVRDFKGDTPIGSIFIASDFNHMTDMLTANFKPMNITIHRLDVSSPHLDLVILAKSNHFLGNCVSSFSAFVKRERDVSHFSTEFWAFHRPKSLFHDSSEL